MKLVKVRSKSTKGADGTCVHCKKRAQVGQVIGTFYLPFAEIGHRHYFLHVSCMRELAVSAPLDETEQQAKQEFERRRQAIITTGDPYAHV